MPLITVTQPFNFAVGIEVKHYPKGSHNLPAAAADFAYANGFAKRAT